MRRFKLAEHLELFRSMSIRKERAGAERVVIERPVEGRMPARLEPIPHLDLKSSRLA